MSYAAIESKFIATPEKGEVSSILIRPDAAKWLLVLGHGAGTNMRHSTLQTIAERLADIGIATFRYQFPYMERGGGGREAQAVALATVRSAAAAAHAVAGDLGILVGGHSYSGRMSSLQRRRLRLNTSAVSSFSPFHSTLLGGRGRNVRSTLRMSLSRCCSYLAPVISWRTLRYWIPSAKNSATRQRYIYLTQQTTDSKSSNARVNPMRTFS